ncbi:unnamed protein product [Peniophora sp. CBMAI 1063]|nr:unnamed protein product [Peniophora sp. CBMAI 1063]
MSFHSFTTRSFYLLLSLTLTRRVWAQDLSIPSSVWNVSTPSSDTRTVREGHANDAANALVSNIQADGSLTDNTESQALASMYTVLAAQDMLSGNASWNSTVTGKMKAWVEKIDIFGNGTTGSLRTNSNGIQWALAAYHVYKAYGDPYFLTFAKNAFDTTYIDYITPSVAAAKKFGPGRNISANASQCFDITAGGIFWLPDVGNNPQVQADTVGPSIRPFAVLAGFLYEETKNGTYQSLGLQTLQFMKQTMWDSPSNLVRGVFDAYICGANTGQSPEVQAWYIYPLSVFANITATSDSDTSASLIGLLRSAVSEAGLNTAWTQTNGVLKDTPDDTYAIHDDEFDSKAILILVQFIEAFLTVQYNSVINLALNGNSYASAPTGPPPLTFSNEGNIMALDILNAAFAMAPKVTASASSSTAVTASSTTSPDAASSQSSTSSSSPVGAIVGGVVGGVGGLAVLVGVLIWWRRKRRADEAALAAPIAERSMIEPFSPSLMVAEPYRRMTSAPQHEDPYRSGLRVGHRSKLARELPPSLPSIVPASSTNPSEAQTSSSAPLTNQQQSDIPALVGRLVLDMLRDARDTGTAPPDYGE